MRIWLIIAVLLFTINLSFAQQAAKTSNPDIQSWKLAGDKAQKIFDKEYENELLYNGANLHVMYESLYTMYSCYAKIETANIKPTTSDSIYAQISASLSEKHPFFIKGGLYFNEQKEYLKASEFFEAYWNIPSMKILKRKDKIETKTSEFQVMKYYAVMSSIQANNQGRSTGLLKRIISEPFISNDIYKESDAYELLADSYQKSGDKENFLKTIESGVAKFPENKYFTLNIINYFVANNHYTKAIEYLDKAIKNDPTNICELNSVKASIYIHRSDYAEAEKIYKETLKKHPDCENSLDGLAVSYIIQAQNLKDEAAHIAVHREIATLNEKASKLYEKSYPLLEKLKRILIARNANKTELASVFNKLRNVYYNLNMHTEFDKTDNEYSKLMN